MELKEYIEIIKKNSWLFLAVIAGVMLVGFAWLTWKPVSYSTSLTINITRSGSETTGEYEFDDFYRLQADERFGETLVEWLKSPVVAADIYQKAGLDTSQLSLRGLSKLLKGEKLSSQLVAVSFSSGNKEDAQKISRAVAEVLEKNANDLNAEQKEKNWFKLEVENPVIVKDRTDTKIAFVALLFLGIFLALWTVFIRHYLK